MVVLNHYIQSVAVLPLKHHPPLIVDPNRVTALAIASELFKPIAGQRRQDLQCFRVIEHLQFTAGIGPKLGRELTDDTRYPVMEQVLRQRVAECSDHLY